VYNNEIAVNRLSQFLLRQALAAQVIVRLAFTPYGDGTQASRR